MNVDLGIASAVAANARYHAQVPALVEVGGRGYTYSELDERCARVAQVLADRDVREGDRVAFLGLNSASFVVTMLATFRIGAIFVPVNFRLAAPELRQVLSLSGATVAVVEEGHRMLVDTVLPDTRLAHRLLVDDDPAVPSSAPTEGWEPWSVLVDAASPWGEPVLRSADDPALLLHTSGTTGLPKGVVLTYGNVWWNWVNVDSRVDTRRWDVTYAAAPLFHIGTLNSFALRGLARGGTLVVRRAFDPAGFLDDVATYGINTTFAVPAMLSAVASQDSAFAGDLSSLRAVVVAGAPVPPSLIERYAEHGVTLQQAWGLTETAPFATHLPADHTMAKIGSCGIPVPYTEVRVVDSVDGTPMPPGQSGELVVRGPNVTAGYWENPTATEQAFDADGWFHTGDIGYADEDGFLFIVDRLKDMIISGGENVYPAEVERALAGMPGVSDVAVIGAPDPKWGEAVVAVISVDEGTTLTLEKVREYASRSIARYKLPQRLEVVLAVPRNASGKLDKAAVRQAVLRS